MPITILVPTPLRPFAADQSRVELAGGAVREALDILTAQYDGLRAHLFRDDGRLRSFVNVYVNDEDIRHLDGLETRLEDGDILSIVPSVAGGSPTVAGDDALGVLPELSSDELTRYSRHLLLPQVGLTGQRRLKAARVLLVGAGGLGSPAAVYLAAAGVGTIGLVDFDVVDATNLQRQILYSTDQVGQPKLTAAVSRLSGLNPHVHLQRHDVRLTRQNALDVIRQYDVVVDGADNFATRYLVNDACVLAGRPNVYGSIFRFEGQVSVFATAGGPCYRCLYPEPPPPGLVPSCAEGGVLGVLPGLVGTLQASEVLKLVLNIGTGLAGRLLLVDALDTQVRSVKVRRDPGCPICGDHPSITALVDYEQFCGVPGGSHAGPGPGETTVEQLRARLDRGDDVWILDVREESEFAICRLPGSSLIPLGSLQARLAEIPAGSPAPDIVVHCKTGGRSAKAVSLLRERGFTNVSNLHGGILAWIDRVDPSLTRY